DLLTDPPIGCHGTCSVQVGASNGLATAYGTFSVTVLNAAPVLSVVPNQTMPHSRDNLTVALSATDADGEPLTYSARVTGPVATAYALDQPLSLSHPCSYYTNYQGQQENWRQGKDGQYFLLPSGELRRWRDAGYSYGPMGLVATLDGSYYVDPSKLWNALPPPQLSVADNQLTIDPASGFVGAFTVQATVTDGIASASRSFTVNVTDTAP